MSRGLVHEYTIDDPGVNFAHFSALTGNVHSTVS